MTHKYGRSMELMEGVILAGIAYFASAFCFFIGWWYTFFHIYIGLSLLIYV